MSWFSEQIKERIHQDRRMLEDAGDELTYAVTGKRIRELEPDSDRMTQQALQRVLRYYQIKEEAAVNSESSIEEQFELLCRPNGLLWREVTLTSGWYKNAVGAMLGRRKSDGAYVALLPGKVFGYFFYDTITGKKIRLNRRTEQLFEMEAYCFYKGFPQRSIGIPDLITYMARSVAPSTYVKAYAMTFLITLVGMLTPRITYLLYGDVIESKSLQVLIAIAVFYISVQISTLLLNQVNSLINSRLNAQLNLSVNSATVARIYSLPATFFRNYSAGELSEKMGSVNSLCSSIISGILSVGITSLFSLVYLTQVGRYAKSLLFPAICITVITVAYTMLNTLMTMKLQEKRMNHSAKNSGLLYSFIVGIQKIKLSGSEKRVFAKWLGSYAEGLKLMYRIPGFLLYSETISLAISSIGQMIMLYIAVQNRISIPEYTAFSSAYGMVSGAFMSLVGIATTLANIRPILKIAEPILEAEPEVSEKRKLVSKLNGTIELSHVSFRYQPQMPLVLNDLSLKIHRNQYVAIVGKTGCGKSTLVRLLLGFESPEKGAVYYDGKDLSALDVRSLRRNIGAVLQNGKLFNGNIFSNITVAAPNATLDDAWKAAEQAGLADDIRQMPMQMHTVISEGSGGISGGQRQRILIARAIVSKPKLLIFDEATSALDNLTQKQVSDSLDALRCTRIVIAHRLSTIRQCDRIIYLENGKIAEDGTYEALIEKNGKFAELVRRQQVDA